MITITTDTGINTWLSTSIFFLVQLKITAMRNKKMPWWVVLALGLFRKAVS